MKNLFSITNSLVKRVALILTLITTIGVGEVWAYAKSTVKEAANPSSGAGPAQVSKKEDSEFSNSATQTTGSFFTTSGTHTYYLKAVTTSDDYLWKGWVCENVWIGEQVTSISVQAAASVSNKSYNYTATWVQPKVDNVNNFVNKSVLTRF